MSSGQVTAALIVRDEAAVLGGCLDSLCGQVNDVVVVDTGSVDASPDIAASYGARLLHYEWSGDFSAARNYALEAATGDWILYIDADERLALPPGVTLRDVLGSPGYAGFQVKFRPRIGFSPYHELRIFRADPRIRFEGRIHEYVMASVRRVCKSDGLRIGQTDASIQHIGYEGDLTRKHERNLPLLARAVEDDPDRVYYWWHLGQTLAEVGNTREAETALLTAIQTARRLDRPRARIESMLAFHALARLYLRVGEPVKATLMLDEGLTTRPHDPALLLLKGRALLDLKRYGEALHILTELPLAEPESFFDPDIAYDLRVFGEWAFDLIGLAHFRAGQFEQAHRSFLAAAMRSPLADYYHTRATLAAARARLQN